MRVSPLAFDFLIEEPVNFSSQGEKTTPGTPTTEISLKWRPEQSR
jgi:hypothetical protein